MAERLRNILQVSALAAGAEENLAHGLHTNGQPLVPDEVKLSGSLTYVDADASHIRVRNDGTDPATEYISVSATTEAAAATRQKPVWISPGAPPVRGSATAELWARAAVPAEDVAWSLETLVVATDGVDAITANGSSDLPYETMTYAVKQLPLWEVSKAYLVLATGVGVQTLDRGLIPRPMLSPIPFNFDGGTVSGWTAAPITHTLTIAAVPTLVEAFTPTSQALHADDNILSITKTGAGWTVDAHVGRLVYGTAAYQVGHITSNTATVLEVAYTGLATFTGTVTIGTHSAGLHLDGPQEALLQLEGLPGGFAFYGLRLSNEAEYDIVQLADVREVMFLGCWCEGPGSITLAGGVGHVNFYGCRFTTIEFWLYGALLNLFNFALDTGCNFHTYFGYEQFSGGIVDACGTLGHGANAEPAVGFEIASCRIRNGTASGVTYIGGTTSSVHDCSINNCADSGVYAYGSGELQVLDVVGTGNDDYGILVDRRTEVVVNAGTTVTGDTNDFKSGSKDARTWVDFRANTPVRNEFDISGNSATGARISQATA